MYFFRLVVCFMFLAFVCSVSAQTANTGGGKTNADRKTECRNIGGVVVEGGGGSFACSVGGATINCTSTGACICTGKCDTLGDDGGLSRVGDSKKKIFATFPRNLSRQRRTQMERLVNESLQAIHAGNGNVAVEKINELITMSRQTTGGGGLNWGDPIECRQKCKHIIEGGNPVGYGVCWWDCIISGYRGSNTGGVRPPTRPPVTRRP